MAHASTGAVNAGECDCRELEGTLPPPRLSHCNGNPTTQQCATLLTTHGVDTVSIRPCIFFHRAGYSGAGCTVLNASARANTGSPVGVEVSGPAYWSTQWTWINAMAQSSPGWWTQRAADRWGREGGRGVN